ncbi:MAG: hypothetical protein M3Q33_04305 [Acidobacteriota bacterium]|nr:hypothetical protein [Acidobacteriota bacterium]
MDITEVPVSFQIGLNDYIELFFNTDAYRGIKVNSPRNLSSFYLPNSRFGSSPTIVLGTGLFAGRSFFRNGQPFVQFPFVGGPSTAGGATSIFGVFPAPSGGDGSAAATFPGIGSAFGSILPGVVLQTTTFLGLVVPSTFTTIPSYLPDAPFINRNYGTSAFSTFTVGGKFRFTGPTNPFGIGIIPFYRFYADKADNSGGFNQLQRGASPGGGSNPFSSNRGDFGLVLFADARLRKYINLSGNIGYIYNSSVRGDFPSGTFTMLDRPDEVISGVALDFPVNQYFQPILEFRSTQYVGGRTPNAFENNPLEGLAGARVYPARWFSIGGAYRYHFNQQDRNSFDSDSTSNSSAIIAGGSGGNITVNRSFSGVPPGFQLSNDPHGFIFQVTAGRRNLRDDGKVENKFADVTNLGLSSNRVTIPCPAEQQPREGTTCSDSQSVSVTTTAVDPENDVLTYNYTVSGGRIVGQGANVTWDLSGATPGTYTITAGVDDGCGVCGKTQTQTITVEACDCVPIAPECVCPTVSVTGPSEITKPGDTMTFTANVSGGTNCEATYNWTVSQGEIIDGQGTPVIRVQTTEAMAGGNITATVNIGCACPGCAKSASETAGIEAPKPGPEERDRFKTLSNDDVKARIQNFYIELNNNPNAQGYIINYGSEKEIARREKQIRDAIRFLKLDASRVTIVRGGDNGSGVETVFFIVPAGAEPPTPER